MISYKTLSGKIYRKLFDQTSFHPLASDGVMKSTKKKRKSINS